MFKDMVCRVDSPEGDDGICRPFQTSEHDHFFCIMKDGNIHIHRHAEHIFIPNDAQRHNWIPLSAALEARKLIVAYGTFFPAGDWGYPKNGQ